MVNSRASLGGEPKGKAGKAEVTEIANGKEGGGRQGRGITLGRKFYS